MQWNEFSASLTAQCHCATVDSDGHPHVAIVWTVVEGERLWFATWKSSKKARNLAGTPRISLVFQPEAEIYLEGTTRLIDGIDDRRRLWTLLPYDAAQFFQSPENPDLLFVEVTPVNVVRFTFGPQGRQRDRWHHGR